MEGKKDELLSMEALKWLHSKEVDYRNRNHEERMKLIEAARILYPENG